MKKSYKLFVKSWTVALTMVASGLGAVRASDKSS